MKSNRNRTFDADQAKRALAFWAASFGGSKNKAPAGKGQRFEGTKDKQQDKATTDRSGRANK